MRFSELFEKYWDNLIVGIVAGLVLYYGLKIQDGIKAGIYIFTISLALILIYTFFIWLGKKYELDKNFFEYLKKLIKILRTAKFVEFFLMLVVVFIAGIGGNLLFFEDWKYKSLGGGLLLIAFGLEYLVLNKMDTREDVKKAKTEIERLLKEARKIKEDVEKSHKDIEKINKNVFDVFSKNGFKTIEERIKALENALKGNSSSFEFREFTKIIDDVKEIKRELNGLKRLGR